MADRFPTVGASFKSLGQNLFMVVFMAGLLLMTGCESVPMPDMSKFDFSFGLNKPVVAIKSSYNKVNIRPTPSTSQPPLAFLKGSDKVQLIEEQGNWLQVAFFNTAGEEQTGWVYKFLVEGYERPQPTAPGATSGSSAENYSEVVPAEESEGQKSSVAPGLPKNDTASPL